MVTSPRMPHTLGEIFTHAQYSISKTATAELGRARLACSSINTCARSEPRPGPGIHPISAASAVANCVWNYYQRLVDQLAKKTWKLIVEVVTTKRLVCKNGHSLVEPPSRVFYTVSVSACLFVGERFFQKVYGRPLPSTSPFTLLAR